MVKGLSQSAMAHQCCFCGKNFNTSSAKQEHEVIHLHARFECDHCGKDYSNRANLCRHLRTKHSSKNQRINTLYSTDGHRFHCGECGSVYTFSEEKQYFDHIQRHLK